MRSAAVTKSWEAKADKAIARDARERAKTMATEYGDGLSAHPERSCPNSPWLEWRYQFKDAAGRRRCITLGQWPFISGREAREMAESLRAGDARAVGIVMNRYGKLQLPEWRTIRGMGDAGLKVAIEREKAWVRYTSRAQHWPHLEKAQARRVLNRLESLLGRMRAFARARGLQLQTAVGEVRAAA